MSSEGLILSFQDSQKTGGNGINVDLPLVFEPISKSSVFSNASSSLPCNSDFELF